MRGSGDLDGKTSGGMLLRFFVCRHAAGAKGRVCVSLRFCRTGTLQAFPEERVLTPFCFPLDAEINAAKRMATSEEYSFTMTGGMAERVHGFCRRVHPPQQGHSGPRLPLVLCIMSDQLWGAFFFKVLEIVEQLLSQEKMLLGGNENRLPATSSAACFLRYLSLQLSTVPRPGQILRIPFPQLHEPLMVRPPDRIPALNEPNDPLHCTEDFIELQVPPLTGGNRELSGVSLARLLWRMPAPCIMTLLAGLLLERRILMVSKSKDVLSAAVHAASALIFPFKWHHVYLPIVPESLKDYIMAPMPFLIGLPSQLLPSIHGLQMSEVTLIDLDLGRCEPAPGSDGDDALVLPMREKLEEALAEAVKNLRSPMEFEGNPRISGIIMDYFAQILKHYRRYIYKTSDDHKLDVTDFVGKKVLKRSVATVVEDNDSVMCGSGYKFDFPGFVASHRKGEIRQFLALFRHSQMFEVFMQERLEMASRGEFPTDDPFEHKMDLLAEQRHRRLLGLKAPVRSLSKSLSRTRNKAKNKVMVSQSFGPRRSGGTSSTGSIPDLHLQKPSTVAAPPQPLPPVPSNSTPLELASSPSLQSSLRALHKFASNVSDTYSGYASEDESATSQSDSQQHSDLSNSLELTAALEQVPECVSSSQGVASDKSWDAVVQPDPFIHDIVSFIDAEKLEGSCPDVRHPDGSGETGAMLASPFGSYDPDQVDEVSQKFAESVNLDSSNEADLWGDEPIWGGAAQSRTSDRSSTTTGEGKDKFEPVCSTVNKQVNGFEPADNVQWAQLVSNLASPKPHPDLSATTFTMGNGNQPNGSNWASFPVGVVQQASPVVVQNSSGVVNPLPPSSPPKPPGLPKLQRSMSRVDMLRLKSQKKLEEMFQSNLVSFDRMAMGVSQPGLPHPNSTVKKDFIPMRQQTVGRTL